MAENIETTLQFNADISDFKSAMAEANKSIKLANSQFAKASAGMDDWSKSTDGLRAKIQQLSDTEAAEKRKLDVLKNAYAQVAAEQGANSTAAVDLEIKINNQEAAIGKTQKALRNYSNELEGLERSVNDAANSMDDLDSAADDARSGLNKAGNAAEDAGDKAEDSGEGWTIVKDVIADMAKNAISWAVDGFKELLFSGDEALAGLAARTGATSAEMSKYNDVMKSIHRNNYGQDYNDIADAMSIVVQTMGDLDKVSLQNVTQNAIALRDTFDMDYQESIRAANSLMDQFGISSDEAFNLIVQGAQQGLNQNGDLLDVINEYSVQFKDAGYSADDMFNMLKNGAETGTWSVDKLGDAVKEFNIRANDGTVTDALNDYRKSLGFSRKDVKNLTADMKEGGDAGQAAYQTILDALLSVDDPTKQYQAGVALFGTMWEDLGADAIAALMTTEGGIRSTTDAMGELNNTKYDTLSSALSGLGRVIQDDLLQPLVNNLAPVAKDIVTWLIDNMGTISPIITGVATAVGVLATALAIQGLIKGVTGAFALLNGTLLANPIVLIVALLAGLVAAFIYLWHNCEGFRDFILGMWETIKAAFSAAKEWCVDALAKIGAGFSDAWAWATEKWAAAGEWFAGIWANIQAGFANVGGWFSEKFAEAWEKVTGAFSSAATWGRNTRAKITAGFVNVGGWFRDKFAEAWEKVTGAFSSAATWGRNTRAKITAGFANVGGWFREKFAEAWENITGAFSGAAKWASGIWSDIKSAFSNVLSDASSIGSDIVSGLWNGINDMAGWIGKKIQGFGDNVLSSLKNFFGIHSPSTLFRDEIGRNLALGIVEGLDSGRSAIARTVKDLGNATMGGLSAGIGHNTAGATAGKQIIINQTNNSPRALSRREIYRQTHNALSFAGGVS